MVALVVATYLDLVVEREMISWHFTLHKMALPCKMKVYLEMACLFSAILPSTSAERCNMSLIEETQTQKHTHKQSKAQ